MLLLLRKPYWGYEMKTDTEETLRDLEIDEEEDLQRFIRGGFGAK
ncbi:MAG: hypothetical protein MPEBLZ_01587 [Candidatus Methanoperedens nitroreducens]|uniref:Uncharacterized protein n=1 Tax=Candidatus Methanoperedens nitratireducens TaxID=1392998 RepID=A0A0P7ZGA3_9EURY|nr:MAG: hypothetical protein MPEBLZ_01587 [Candidatus Methanoperedens sp. BLZ1]CAG0969544.1 hypothetical protein METP2_01308 [Methanosarcinales archaeon]